MEILYNAGSGVPKNDLISLYWFDRASDNGITEAKADRNGILNAYRSSLSAEEPPRAEETMSIEQQRKNIIRICIRRMPEVIQKNTSLAGICKPCRARFDHPGTPNIGFFQVEPTELNGKPYAFKIGIFRARADLLVSSYMIMSRMEDILGYLSDKSHLPVLVSTFQDFLNRWMNNWNESIKTKRTFL